MILLERFDAKAARLCAQTPYSTKDAARTIPGARWDANWKHPSDPNRQAKVWHWPTSSLPAILRAFPDVATRDPLITRGMERAREINAGREATRAACLALVGQRPWEQTTPSGLKLHAHQRNAVLHVMQGGGARALYLATGTGKTPAAGMVLSLLVQPIEGMRVGVVVCPVTLVRAAWLPDMSRFFPDMPLVDLRDEKKGHDREYAVHDMVNRKGRAVAVVNYEAVRTDANVRRVMSGAMVVLDECSKIKDPKATITEVMREIAPTFRGVVLLSGTPAPNNILEYLPQMKVLAACSDYDPFPGTQTHTMETYCDRRAVASRFDPKKGERVDVMAFVPKPEMVAQFHARMQPVAEWLTKEECVDLPPKQFVKVPIDLERTTAARYCEMRDLMEIAIVDQYGATLRQHATNALAKLMRLRQITAGFVPAYPQAWAAGTDDAQVMVPLGREKLDWLLEFVGDTKDRVLVWTQFQHETVRVVKALRESKIAVDFIDGTVNDKLRTPILDRFRAGELQVVVAHPGTMQFGVSLPGISLSVFMSCSHSLEQFAQAQDRIHGIGRGDATKRSTFYSLLARANGEDTVDQEIQACLDGKKEMLELVFKIDAQHRKSDPWSNRKDLV